MQVTFDREQHHLAAAKAAVLGVSLAEYIRRVVANDLADEEEAAGSISEIFGIGDSGGGDVARHADEYLGEALARAHIPERPTR
jgi:hypothetical protein